MLFGGAGGAGGAAGGAGGAAGGGGKEQIAMGGEGLGALLAAVGVWFRFWLIFCERLSGRVWRSVVIALSVSSGFEFFGPGRRRRAIAHLGRWEEGKGWFGSGWRSGGLGCWC